MTDVFEASIASGWRGALDLREYLLLELELFGRRFEHPIRVDDASLKRLDDLDPIQRGATSAEIVQVSTDPVQDMRARFGARVGDLHPMAGRSKNLGDAVAHEAAAEDRDALSRHGHPAV